MKHVRADNLKRFIAAICAGAGSDATEAGLVAENLVAANLAGHDSHGVGMIPTYITHALDDRLAPGRHVKVIADNGPILTLDGQLGYGQVIGREAMELGIAKAQALGVAVVALRNTHHLGRIGAWGEMCALAGLVSIHYVNVTGHAPLVAPFGGSDSRFTTNPYCTALPATASHPMMILDMATSQVALGKIRVAFNKGVDAPAGALIDRQGRSTTDPGVMYREPRGSLLPMGEHKGYGLALVCEMLAGALTGGGTCLPEREARDTIINNMLSIIIDPAAVGDAATFRDEVERMTAHVKASPPAPGVEAVLFPGDPERASRAEREATGIPIDDRTWQELVETAGRVGLTPATIDQLIGN